MELNPISGWPSDVIAELKRRVRRIANGNETREFYIGRTNDLEVTSSRHGCDNIIPIYESTSVRHVKQLESELIRTLLDHPKCSNDAYNSRGAVSEGYINYVYIAVWY